MMTSAERVLEYCDLEPEKQPKKPEEVSQNWPSDGRVEFRSVFYRYCEDAEPVLRNLSFVINPKEKIGTFIYSKIQNRHEKIEILFCPFEQESWVVLELERVH